MNIMATTTANLGLTKPTYTEAADIAVINANMDKIDVAVGNLRERVNSMEDGGDAYVLPAATTNMLGGVKVGTGLAISADGTLRVNLEQWQGGSY